MKVGILELWWGTAPQPLVGFPGFCGKDPCCRPISSLDARFTGRHSGKDNVGKSMHSRTCLHCMMLHVTERRLERSPAFPTGTGLWPNRRGQSILILLSQIDEQEGEVMADGFSIGI